jgi:hypothetical protein
VVGQAKNRSPVHLLTRSQTRPHEMFMARAGLPLINFSRYNLSL